MITALFTSSIGASNLEKIFLSLFLRERTDLLIDKRGSNAQSFGTHPPLPIVDKICAEYDWVIGRETPLLFPQPSGNGSELFQRRDPGSLRITKLVGFFSEDLYRPAFGLLNLVIGVLLLTI